MPDLTILAWMFALITLVPAGALLAGRRQSSNIRAGLMLACSGAWLATACLVGTAAVVYS